jgi:hypothetical protein
MTIFWQSKLLAAKIETAYGTDSVPTGGIICGMVEELGSTRTACIVDQRDTIRRHTDKSNIEARCRSRRPPRLDRGFVCLRGIKRDQALVGNPWRRWRRSSRASASMIRCTWPTSTTAGNCSDAMRRPPSSASQAG